MNEPAKPLTTITTAQPGGDHGYAVGDRVRVTDPRGRWTRFWHWLIRKKQPKRDFIITSVDSQTEFTIK